jgi:hypothetical protein
MKKRFTVKTIMFLALAMFVPTVFNGCESDHHQRHGDYGYPGPGYERDSHHNDWNGDRDDDRDRDRR